MRYYRVIKDHPLWDVGAILSNEDNSDNYRPISDIFTKELDVKGQSFESWTEGRELVENQPEFFERVHKVNVLKQAKYVTKTEARKLHDKLYK